MYDTFYNAEGKPCLIKISRKFLVHKIEQPFRILLRFKPKNDVEWLYHSPTHQFESLTEVINFITVNLENENMQFKISPVVNTISGY